MIEDNPLEHSMVIAQGQDPLIKEIKNKLEHAEDAKFEMRNGIVYQKEQGHVLFYVPANMESNVFVATRGRGGNKVDPVGN